MALGADHAGDRQPYLCIRNDESAHIRHPALQ